MVLTPSHFLPIWVQTPVEPFLKHKDKWSIILALTSNPGADDFEMLKVDDDYLFERILKKFNAATSQQIMFVVGATRPQYFEIVRKHAPDNFLLVPGIGAQGGSLEEVCRYGLNSNVGLIVNSSRQIIYAGSGRDFDNKAASQAKQIQQQMKQMLVEFKITG
jgi:orotidine-5'-phosphate decarboxylase